MVLCRAANALVHLFSFPRHSEGEKGVFFVVVQKKKKKTRRRRQEGENTQTFVDNPFGVPETRRSGTRGDCAGPARGVRASGQSRGTYRLYLPGCSALKSEKLTLLFLLLAVISAVVRVCASRALLLNRAATGGRARGRRARAA